MNIRLHLLTVILLMLITVYIGVVGYSIIERWDFLDSLYMTVITLSSVGFGEVHHLSHAGRIFTICLIIMGLGTVIYGLTTIASIIIEGKLNRLIRRRRMERRIMSLNGHIIVCGLQEMTKVIIEEFRKTKTHFVAVGKGIKEWIDLTGIKDILYIDSSPLDENVLEHAGIKNAKGLIAAQKNDAQNVFVVLSARELNPALRIVAKVEERASEQKFYRAGANAVVCPDSIGGLRLASEMIRPAVVDFLNVMMRTKETAFRIEEVTVTKKNRLAGKTLAEADLARKTGVIVIAKKNNTTGEYKYNPTGLTVINHGDILIVLGETEQINALRDLCCR